MPEGHTVHRLARAFGELFAGEPLAVSSPQGRFAAGAALLDGRVLVASEAWGKQMFLGFAGPGGASDDVRWLRVHLGLYGAWTFAGDGSTAVVHAIGAPRRRIGERETVPAAPGGTPSQRPDDAWSPPPPRGAGRVRLVGAHAVADLTGPTACVVVTDDEKRAVEDRLGPDPIRDPGPGEPDPRDAFVAAVRRSRSPVGLLLMNQDVVAGVGNIYRAEALFRAGLDPMRPGRDVPAEDLRTRWDGLVVLMHDGGRSGARNFAVRATGASAEMRRPVSRLATMAMATIQWMTIVPTSERGCRSTCTAGVLRRPEAASDPPGGCGERVSGSDIRSSAPSPQIGRATLELCKS